MVTFLSNNSQKEIEKNAKKLLEKGYIIYTNKFKKQKPKKNYIGSIKKNHFNVYIKKHSVYPFTLIFYGRILENKNINNGKAYIKGFFTIRPTHILIYLGLMILNISVYIASQISFSGVLAFTWPLMLYFEWRKSKPQKHELIWFINKIFQKVH